MVALLEQGVPDQLRLLNTDFLCQLDAELAGPPSKLFFRGHFSPAQGPRLHSHPRRPAFPLAAVILGGNELLVLKAEIK